MRDELANPVRGPRKMQLIRCGITKKNKILQSGKRKKSTENLPKRVN